MKLRKATESVGWLNSVGPLVESPRFPQPCSGQTSVKEFKKLVLEIIKKRIQANSFNPGIRDELIFFHKEITELDTD